jgi:hypothetical protein
MTPLFVTVPLITVPVAAALLLALFFARFASARRRLRRVLSVWCCISVVLCAAWSWRLRDLFESYGVPSTGGLAFERFLELFWIPFGLTALILLVALYPRKKFELYHG